MSNSKRMHAVGVGVKRCLLCVGCWSSLHVAAEV